MIAIHSSGTLDAALLDAYPWVEFLPTRDRKLFVEELTRAPIVAVAQLVHEWKSTAEIHADPELAHQLGRPLEASGEAVTIPAD